MPNGERLLTQKIVMQSSRQVGKKAREWFTLSALRTMVVTTLLGRSGFQYGAKPVELPLGQDTDELFNEVADLLHELIQRYAPVLQDKENSLMGAPAIMAGLGVAAHRTVTHLPAEMRDDSPLSTEAFFELIGDIRWAKELVWDGVATRKTPSGVTTVAGPKEVGYAVADAIEKPSSPSGRKIRGEAVEESAEADEPTEAEGTTVSALLPSSISLS
jgi:DNA sulfur modification protein DndB